MLIGGLTIDPSAEELSEIAFASADSGVFMSDEPRVAMFLLHHGLLQAQLPRRSRRPQSLPHEKNAELALDGDQLDAALVPEVGKPRLHSAAGNANILVFPT